MRRNYVKTFVTIVTFLCLVIGTVSVVAQCLKIFETGGKLLVLNDNAMFYNEQPYKTDKMTKDYMADLEKRQEIYNSEDPVIRIFSNLPLIVKLPVWFLASIGVFVIPISVLLYVLQRAYAAKKRQVKRQQRRERGTDLKCC